MKNSTQKWTKLLIGFLAPLMFAGSAHAILEVSVGYSGILSSSAGGNWTIPGATYSGAYGLTGEIRLNFPTSSWQVGGRYTNLGLNVASGANTIVMSNSAVSGLIAYRLINTGILLGPVVTYAVTNSGSLQNSASSTGASTATAGTVSQYTAGLEVGIKFPFLLAVEFGYGNLTMSNFSSSQSLANAPTKVDLGGTYARAVLGFSF